MFRAQVARARHTEKANFPMARIKNQTWSYNAGERGINWCRAYEKHKGSNLMLEWFEDAVDEDGNLVRDPETGTVTKVRRRESVGHRDRNKAEQAARDKAKALLSESSTARVTSLRQLLDRYLKEVTPTKKESKQLRDPRAVRVFLAYLQDRADAGEKERGPERHPSTLDRHDWHGFIAARRAGKITGWTRQCRNGMIRDDLKFLVAILNWASASDETEPHFLQLNPWRSERRRAQRMKLPEEKDPRRPGISDEQHHALMRAFPNWRFVLVAVLCRETLHRANSVRLLRKEDIDRKRRRITWPGQYDKAGRRLVTPLTPEVEEALDSIPTPTVLSPWLIPSERDPGKPVSRDVLNIWMQKAKKVAGIEEERVGFHAYKRAGVRTTEFGKFRDKLAEHLTGTTIDTLRDVYDDVSYEELSEAMEMLRNARRRA